MLGHKETQYGPYVPHLPVIHVLYLGLGLGLTLPWPWS